MASNPSISSFKLYIDIPIRKDTSHSLKQSDLIHPAYPYSPRLDGPVALFNTVADASYKHLFLVVRTVAR